MYKFLSAKNHRSAAALVGLSLGIPLIVSAFLFLWAGEPFPTDLDEQFQEWLDQGRELRHRRLFDEAVTAFNRILEIDPLHNEATYELADTYYCARRWVDAMDWFYAVGLLDPQRREAYFKRWTSILRASKSDSLLEEAAVRAIRREIAEFLKSYPWDWETLYTAFQGAVLVGDSLLSDELSRRILENFPDSPAGYRILSDRFYEGLYPIWDDNENKIKYIQDFLKEYPVSEFRETAWLYLVSALNESKDLTSLRAFLNQWMVEDPRNPLPYERTVHYLFEQGVSPDSLLPLARQAVENCRGWRGKPHKNVQQRLLEGKALYARTRLNISRVLVALSRLAEARLWLLNGLKHSGFGVDDQETTASMEYFLGVIAEKEGRWDDALDRYVNALIQGDVRGRWTAAADSALELLYFNHFENGSSDLMTVVRQRRRYEGPVFEDVTVLLGLGGVKAGRVAWGDADGDGYDDLLLGGGRLFLNRRGEEFVEVTENCGLKGRGIRGGVWADVDLDGDQDLFCAGNGGDEGGDRLYINEGKNRDGGVQFRDATAQCSLIRDNYPTEGAAWGDLQGDGRPDLYVANYELPGAKTGEGTPDFLYVNLADPDSPLGFRFERLGPDSGLNPPFGENLCGRGVNWGDFDGDGDQDIYVSNYRLQENFLWENSGAGQLKSRACFYGVAGLENDGWWGHTIGSEWGDFDNDGDLDLITANLAHPRYIEFSNRTCLYENRLDEDGIFREVRGGWGIKYEETHSDPAWGDVDADGDLDLYLTSVYPNRRSFLYLNDLENQRFTDVTYLAGVRITNGWGCAFSDFDNDGDLDLAVGSNEGVHLFRNLGTDRHWIEFDVRAAGGAYGTRLILKRGQETQLREISGGKGTTSQHSRIVYFGLGESDKPVNLEVHFPSGEVVSLKRLEVDRRIVITPP